jgi:hypothetical protein
MTDNTPIKAEKQMKLHIARDLDLSLDAVTKTFAIIAQRRKGKTYTANVIAEEMVKAKIPWVALDPTGAWWGLRSSADGKQPGLPVYVFGGDHGDLPLERTAGKMIADLVVDHPAWYVLDFSHFESKEAERQLATDFAERFYRRKGTNKSPMHLFVDEADMFAPQRTPSGDQRMLGAFESIVRRGGIRGIGTTMITQRAAVLNKNVLEQIDVLIALRTVGPNDRKAIAGYVEAHGSIEQQHELIDSLASLELGEAWVWEPGADLFDRIHVRARETYNSSATPNSSEPQPIATLAEVDLEKIRTQMQATIAKAKADDPKDLRQKIGELERQLRQRPAETVERVVQKEVPLLQRGEVDQLKSAAESVLEAASAILRAIGQYVPPKSTPTPRAERPEPRTPVFRKAPSETNITGGAKRMLTVLASRYPMTFTKSQLAALSKMSPRSGTFGTYMSLLRSQNLIEQSGDQISLTDRGKDYAGDVSDVPQSNDEVIDMWRGNLTGGARRMFDVLVDNYPRSLSKYELGEATEMSSGSGTFGTYLSMLNRNGLIERNGDGIKANESLFAMEVNR